MGVLQIRDRERELLILKLYNMGYTYKQIAGKLDITRGRVGQIYRRILREKRRKVVNE